MGEQKDGSPLAGRFCNFGVLTDHGGEEIFIVVGFQCLLRTFADSMGLIETVEEDEDIFEDERKFLFDRRVSLEKNFESVERKDFGIEMDDEVI